MIAGDLATVGSVVHRNLKLGSVVKHEIAGGGGTSP